MVSPSISTMIPEFNGERFIAVAIGPELAHGSPRLRNLELHFAACQVAARR
jgi:hypothetical protein